MQLEEYITSRQIAGVLADRLRDAACPELVQLCEALRPSANTCSQLLMLLETISRRDCLSVPDLLKSEHLQEILNAETLSRKDKQKRVRQELEKIRYPERARIEQALESARQELLSDCKLRLELPRDLEGDSLSLQLQFRSPEDLSQLGARLERAAQHPALETVFAVLRGEYE